MLLRDFLAGKLNAKEMSLFTGSFDIIGDIGVIEVKRGLRRKEKLIGNALLEMHKNLKTVCRRDGMHEGVFRTQKLKVIAGEKRKITIHRESGCLLKLDIEKCYFSVRSGTERLRLASLIKEKHEKTRKKEKILVMFSGVGPYVFVIAKNAPYRKITGIEMNGVAHRYALINAALNKAENVELIEGDVRKIVPGLKEKFDRIIMPLPRTAEEFIGTALAAAKRGTAIHLYGFLAEDDFKKFADKVKAVCKEHKRPAKILGLVKCGQFSPRIYRICLDFRV